MGPVISASAEAKQEVEEKEEEEGEATEAGTFNVTVWKSFIICVWLFCFFIFLKNVSIQSGSFFHYLL